MIKKITRPEMVPSRTLELRNVDKFVCSDGKEFEKENDAINWESQLEMEAKVSKIPSVIPKSIDFGTYYNCFSATFAYFIKTKEEYELVCEYLNRYKCGRSNTKWNTNAFENEDWYIFYHEENNDMPDGYFVETLTEQKSVLNEYVEHFKL